MSKMSDMRLSGGIPASALGDPGSSGGKTTLLAARRASFARGELVKLPVYGEVWMDILGSAAMEHIEGATLRHMAALGIPFAPVHIGSYNLHRACRILALSIKDPADRKTEFGSLEEWQDEREELVVAAAAIYQDVRRRLDPLSDPELSEEEAGNIMDALKKKDAIRLRSYDAVTLTSFMISGAVQPSSSPIPSSKSSPSSAE